MLSLKTRPLVIESALLIIRCLFFTPQFCLIKFCSTPLIWYHSNSFQKSWSWQTFQRQHCGHVYSFQLVLLLLFNKFVICYLPIYQKKGEQTAVSVSIPSFLHRRSEKTYNCKGLRSMIDCKLWRLAARYLRGAIWQCNLCYSSKGAIFKRFLCTISRLVRSLIVKVLFINHGRYDNKW